MIPLVAGGCRWLLSSNHRTRDVLEKILRGHRPGTMLAWWALVGGLWQPAAPRAPPAEDGWIHDSDGSWGARRHLPTGPGN
jgi:hypothetical protein